MKGYIAHWKLLEGGEVDYQVLGLATALLPGKKPGPCKLLTAIPTVTLQSPLSKLTHPTPAPRRMGGLSKKTSNEPHAPRTEYESGVRWLA
jgi:hypothetical protein